MAAVIFLGGCNFRCPFCQNGDLVLRPESQGAVSEEEIFTFLKKRKGILTGVCITGGEPTLSAELGEFITRIKEMGYLVKLDTNGYRPGIVRKLIEDGLLDYIAMDIKNSMERYSETVGLEGIETKKIRETAEILMNSGIEYEFRTTVVRELHRKADLEAIGREIEGAEAYYLQGYEESQGVIAPGFHAYDREEMEEMAALIKPFVPNVKIRG